VSDRPLPNPAHSRQAAKRFRRRGRRLARRLLDEAYAQYLSGVPSLHNSDSINNDLNISVPSPLPPPPLQLPSPPPNQVPSPSRSPTPPFEDPDSPHSALTQSISRLSSSFYSIYLSPLLLSDLLSWTSTSSTFTSEFDFKRRIHWWSSYPSSSTSTLLPLWSRSIIRHPNPPISTSYLSRSFRVLYHRARPLWPEWNQASDCVARSGLHNSRLPP